MTRVTFVRHAMPSVDPLVTPAEWELSAEGVESASGLAIPRDSATALWSSPERKSRQTIALATGTPLAEVATDARFREVDRVERVHEEFRAARRRWVAGERDSDHEGWERQDSAADRMDRGLRARIDSRLVVGTHGMVLVAWLVSVELVPAGEAAVAFWDGLRLPHVLEVELTRGGAAWVRDPGIRRRDAAPLP